MWKNSILFTLCLLAVLTLATSANAESGRDRHDRELIFGVRGLDSIGLTTFGGNFGFRYFLSDNYSLRPSFFMMTDERVYPTYREDFLDSWVKEDQTSIDLMVERHLEPHGRVFPYWGLGVSMDTATYESVPSLPDSLRVGIQTKKIQTRDSFAIIGALGVQWEVNDAIRFGGEYLLRYRYSKYDHETFYHEEDTRTQESESKSFGATASSLYLAVRF